MAVRIFVAPQIGSGFPGDGELGIPPDPYRSLLHGLIDIRQGDWFDEIDLPVRRISICCVRAPQARLDSIAADSRVTPMLPTTAMDDAHLQALLDAPFTTYPLAWRGAAKARLEAWGVNTGWIVATSTMRQVLKALLKVAYLAQKADGLSDAALRSFLLQGLDATFAGLPIPERDAVMAWMQSKDLDISWIASGTTVRQIQNFIATNHTCESGFLGKFRFAGGVL